MLVLLDNLVFADIVRGENRIEALFNYGPTHFSIFYGDLKLCGSHIVSLIHLNWVT